MSVIRVVPRTEVEAAKCSSECVPFSLEAESQVDATSDCSSPPMGPGPMSTVTSNGPGPSSSPISTLLEELLIMIFDDVITSASSSCPSRSGGKRAGWWLSSPRSLASVSKTWRSIAFACPRLWRHVHITPLQSVHALREQLRLSEPLPIHLTIHQWPFRNPIPASGPFSIVALTVQLQSILATTGTDDTTCAPASQRVESIAINATESSTFLNFVLQTWTGRGSSFPALRNVAMNGNVCANWSRSCFFDKRNAPQLERLELSNVVIAYEAHRLSWGIGHNLTTLVWAAPPHKQGSIFVSVSCFHHVVSSFPNLVALELHGHVAALEFATLESLQASGVTPLRQVRSLRVTGQAFVNASAAFILYYLLPSLRQLAVRGKACSGPVRLRTVTLALQALVCMPKVFGWPIVLPHLEDLDLDCVDGGDECEEWKLWCTGEIEVWRQWQEVMVDARKEGSVGGLRMHIATDEPQPAGTDTDTDTDTDADTDTDTDEDEDEDFDG